LFPCIGMYAVSLVLSLVNQLTRPIYEPRPIYETRTIFCSLEAVRDIIHLAFEIAFAVGVYYFAKACLRIWRQYFPGSLTGLFRGTVVSRYIEAYFPDITNTLAKEDSSRKDRCQVLAPSSPKRISRVTKMQMKVKVPTEKLTPTGETPAGSEPPRELSQQLGSSRNVEEEDSLVDAVYLSPDGDKRTMTSGRPLMPARDLNNSPPAYDLLGQLLVRPIDKQPEGWNDESCHSVTEEAVINNDHEGSVKSAKGEDEEEIDNDISLCLPREELIVIKRKKDSPLWVDILPNDKQVIKHWQMAAKGEECDCACHTAVKVKPKQFMTCVDCCGDSISSTCTCEE